MRPFSFFLEKDRPRAGLSHRLLLSLILLLSACRAADQPPTPSAVAVLTAPPPTEAVSPAAPLGSRENPILFAFPPDPHPSAQKIKDIRQLTDFLSRESDLLIAAILPTTPEEWLDGLMSGQYHIAYLPPLVYAALPPESDLLPAVAQRENDQTFYSAQFLAHRARGFKAYFDPQSGQNTAEPAQALAQFRDRRPCWSEPTSLAGYLVPRAYLAQAGVTPLAPAFLGSHPSVLRALYLPGLCDFGATYSDARTFPTLQGEFPAIREEIQVIWRTPPIIPYDLFVLSRRIPEPQRILFAQRLQSLPFRPEKTLLTELFNIQSLEIVDEARYREFLSLMRSLPLDLKALFLINLP